MTDINKSKERRTTLLGRKSRTGRRAHLLALDLGEGKVRFFRARKYLPGQPEEGDFTLDGISATVEVSKKGRVSFDLSESGSRKLAGKLSTAAQRVYEGGTHELGFGEISPEALAVQAKAEWVVARPGGWTFGPADENLDPETGEPLAEAEPEVEGS